MKLSENIFRNYDIRGIYPTEINEEAALHIGKGIGTFLIKKNVFNIVVGRDNRVSSPSIAKNFLTGLISTGCNATYINNTITPIIHFLTCTQNFEAGVVITASHNPANYTGFRLDLADAYPVYGDEIVTLSKIIEEEKYSVGAGLLLEQDLSYSYIDYLKNTFKSIKKHKVLIDTGNGSASEIAPKILESLGCEVTCMNTDIDGGFALGVADPENPIMMDRLSSEVRSAGVDVGFAFDEDADRFGVVDAHGVNYPSDKLLMLFAEHELKSGGGDVLFDVKSTHQLFSIIQNKGGNPKMLKTGHPYFLKAMKSGALLGAEYSGHFYFARNYFGYDDGIYAACKILEILTSEGTSLSNLMDRYQKLYHTTEIKLSCPDDLKYGLLEKLTEVLSGMKKGYKSFIAVDGIRLSITDTGWFLVRASNTSPYLSVRAEGKSLDEVKLALKRLEQMLEPFGVLDLAELKNTKIYYS